MLNKSLPLLLLVAVGCYEDRIEPIPGTTPPLSKSSTAKVQQCFIDNLFGFTEASHLRYDNLTVLVSDRVPSRYIAYYVIPTNQPPMIVINEDAPNQLSGYAHELVRHHCYMTGSCDYQQTSLSWTGPVGELWSLVENLSLEFCK